MLRAQVAGLRTPGVLAGQHRLLINSTRPATCASSQEITATTSQASAVDVEKAWSWLEKYTTQDALGAAQEFKDSEEMRTQLRETLELAVANPWPAAEWNPGAEPRDVLLGVLASDVRLAVRALRDWTQALGVPMVPIESRVSGIKQVPQVTGTVYIKYNALSKVCYVERFGGEDRGVLINLGRESLGHFPLGLFDENMTRPPVI